MMFSTLINDRLGLITSGKSCQLSSSQFQLIRHSFILRPIQWMTQYMNVFICTGDQNAQENNSWLFALLKTIYSGIDL